MIQYRTVNPENGLESATFPTHSDSEVQSAIATAAEVFGRWRDKSFAERAMILSRAAKIMRDRVEEFSALITIEMGKLIGESRGETLLSADILEYYANNAASFLAPQALPQSDGDAFVVSEPIGVLFGIEPWNFPYYQLARFVAPNLMAGNTILLKHAPSVPQCAELFALLFVQAGAEVGVYTNLRLTNEQSAAVIADDRVRGVALTGSERAGSAVAGEAGKALKPTTLELGGSDPFIVLEDANLEKAVEWAVWSRLLNCGQGCVCAKRFIVVESLYEQFLEGVLDGVRARKIGDPMEDGVTLGPLSSENARNRLLDQIKRSVDAGATLLTGGKPMDRPGFFLEPAVLADIRPGNPAYSEEFFGPVFLMFKVKDEKEAVSLANDSSFGLAAVVFSEDAEKAQRIAKRIETGMVFINHPAWTAPDLPFGGVKRSGFGRELSSLGIQQFINKKLIRSQSSTSALP